MAGLIDDVRWNRYGLSLLGAEQAWPERLWGLRCAKAGLCRTAWFDLSTAQRWVYPASGR